MQEVSATDRPDFTLRKKSCQRDRAQPICHGRCVVIGLPKQAPSASAATEHEGSQRLMAMCSPIGGQQQIQVLAGRFGVPKLELYGLPLLHDVADCHRSGGLIGPDKIPDKKISPLEPIPMFVDDDADM
jgi:hypothetical protein